MSTEAEQQVTPQSGAGCSCGANGAAAIASTRQFVYAIGRIQPRALKDGVAKELAQAIARNATKGTDAEQLQAVLANREFRYLVRSLCWVLTIEGVDVYTLFPRDPADYDLLVDATRPRPRTSDSDLVVGVRSPIAPSDVCGGLQLPSLAFDQIYSYDADKFIASIPRPDSADAQSFAKIAEDLYSRLVQLADNAGAADEHRAVNYLAVRYPPIYSLATEAYGRNETLAAVDVRLSRLAGARSIYDVIFSYASRTTDVTQKYFVRVDVTDEFPFLVSKLSPYYDR